MDNQQPDVPMEDTLDEMEDDEVEVTREELITSLQTVVRDLSDGLKGADREAYTSADDLAQNDWFFAGVSDEEGQYAITMWPAEGEEEMLRIDIGSEDDVHKLADDPDQVAALTDDFIAAMDEEYEEYEEYDDEEDEDEEYDEDDLLEEEDEIIGEEDETISRDGNLPPR